MSLAKSRTLAAVFAAALAAMVFTAVPAFADGPVITKQPESVTVAYPEGAQFSVEVADIDNVASFQWELTDQNSIFVLDGQTAHTPTLEVVSTEDMPYVAGYRCIITDLAGNQTVSDWALLDLSNREEDKPVLYVGEYALEPGDTLDLADTMLGEGTIAFSADGLTITYTDVYFSNKYAVRDTTLSPAIGTLLINRGYGDNVEYHFVFNGTNFFNNTYYDADYNAAGVTMNSFFACGDDGNKPTVIFEGDGELYLVGGGNQIYSDANVEIDLKLTTLPRGAIFCDGIRGFNVIIDEGAQVNLNVNGTAIHTEGDLRIYDGAQVNITSVAPHVSVGPTTKNVFYIIGSVYMQGAEVNIDALGDAAQFIPYGAALAVWNGITLISDGSVNMDASTLNIKLHTSRSIDTFAVTLCGIEGDGVSNAVVLENGSVLNIQVDAPDAVIVTGINVPGIVDVDATSSLSVDVCGMGESFGIIADRLIRVAGGQVSSVVRSAGGSTTYGIVGGGAEFTMGEGGGAVYSLAEGGIAMAFATGTEPEGEPGYDDSYEPSVFMLRGQAEIITPDDAAISLAAVHRMGEIQPTESVFSASDPQFPAEEVLIAATGTEPAVLQMVTTTTEGGNGTAAAGSAAGNASVSEAGTGSHAFYWILAAMVLGAAVVIAVGWGTGRAKKDE